MLGNQKSVDFGRLLAKFLIAGSVFLWPMANAFAVANLTLTTSFTPAETGRTYMDIGGTWDGSNNAAGDTFSFTIDNAGPNSAFDISDIVVDIPSGFVLGQTSVSVTDSPASCNNLNGITANQVGPNRIDIAIPANRDIDANCSYRFDLVLTTDPSVAVNPVHAITFNSSYNEFDDIGPQQTFSATELIAVRAGGLSLTKTTTESNPLNGDPVDFNVNIQNPGSGGLFDVNLHDLLGAGLTNVIITPLAGSPAGTLIPISPTEAEYLFNYVDPGANFNVRVRATTDFPSATCPTLSNTASITDRTSIVVLPSSVSILFDLAALSVTHINTSSRCVLCGTGTVTLRLTNASSADVNNIVITEDFLASDLTITGVSTFDGGLIANPVPSGTQYTWTLPAAQTVTAGTSVDLVFDVTYDTSLGINEDLARNNTTISASVDYELSCGITQPAVSSGPFSLILDQPLPQVTKFARNVDANQAAYAPTTFGHVGDDVIWQVLIENAGPTNMQDVVLNDEVTGNFTINYICPDAGTADLAAAGTPPASCFSTGVGGVTTINDFEMNFPFGNAPLGGGDDVLAGTTEEVYYVGKVTATCGVETNTNNIEWGCDVDGTLGGLNSSQILAGGTNDTGSATLSTSDSGAIAASSVTHTVRGIDGGPEIGSRGLVTITVLNDTGGTIRNVVIDDVLPTSYVVDNTFTPTFDFFPAYGGDYGGQSDQMAHINIDTTPANLLNNIAPRFILTSDDTGDNATVDVNLFRHGDSFTITFQIVLVDPARFDLVADLDLAPEIDTGTDPVSTFSINNNLTITYDDTCDFSAGESYNENPTFEVDVEDIDVSITDALFILTNDPGTPLNLRVDVVNNGGHVADNYTVYVALGEAMTLQNLPVTGNCIATSNLPPHPTWNDPAEIPPGAAIYACTPGPIAPGAANFVRIIFPVEKTNSPAIDDLTFRADVVGEIHLFGSTLVTPMPLILPTPATIAKTSPINTQQPANNYSFDAIRSRVLGFNLVKSVWYCAENDPLVPEPAPPTNMLSATPGAPDIPTLEGNLNSQIGEDCAYRVESGGWFGFFTAGFDLIEVQNVAVTDVLPDGQGFIPYDTAATPFKFSNTPGIILDDDVTGGAGTTPLDETDITWRFNTAAGIKVADKFFRVDFKTRLLNDNVDLDYSLPLAGPNLHGNPSINVATSSFTAVFKSDPIDGVEQPAININVSDTADSPLPGYILPRGYPDSDVRTIRLIDVEPNLIVTKTVCNESLAAAPPIVQDCIADDLFTDSVADGDTNDSYIYRITLTNEATSPVRSPAFNVIATDILDASDQMFIVDFATDGLDNNGDGSAANGDAGEIKMYGDISNNIVNDTFRPIITLDESHGAPFAQIDSGASVTYYYRVDPDISIAPLQTLTNTVTMSYDSLDGASGNQNDPAHENDSSATSGRARIYTSIPQIADVIMIPVISFPKIVVEKANPVAGVAANDVSVGEEIRYVLVADIPVANLRLFTIRDELPLGIRCIEGQTVNLDAFPYDAAGFWPGGEFAGTCGTAINGRDFVQWNFGNQAVTIAQPGQRFNFAVSFIARVENSGLTNENTTLTNGGIPITDPSTCTSATGGGVGVCYVNDSDMGVSLDFEPVSITVREPDIWLSKSFLPVENSDAADVLTVTVVAENRGTTAAYNLQILDDLVGSDMTYIGNVAGPNPPENVDLSVPNQPIFSWDRAAPAATNNYEILPGVANAKTFTFQVQVDTTAQPLELLDNTIESKWDSLPGQDVALNHLIVPQGIGPDGSLMGLRNGLIPNPDTPDTLNDYVTAATASTSVLPLTMTKNDLDVGVVVPTIGAHRNFEVVINLPEGTTENLIVDDVLAFAGVSYVLSRDGVLFDVTYTFEDIISINGQPPAEAVFRGATAGLPTLPVDGDSGTITWDIGQVITDEEDDYDGVANAINPRIIINYFARPNNDAATNVGVDLQNSATVNYDNGEDASPVSINDTTAIQTVLEPDLAITKAVSNFTNAGVDPVAGDVLEYTVTIDNIGGNSTAFDSNIVDTLDDNLLFDASFAPTAILDASGSNILGFVPLPTITAAPASTLTWGRLNSDNSLDIPDNSTLVLTYRAVVQNTIQPNVVISNSALVDWTSLNDTDPSNAYERTGDGCPAAIVPPDIYCSAPAVANITALNSNDIVKRVINDTWDDPLDGVVRIGDIITYQLDVNIQQGTTASVNILDAIEPGMAFVDVVSINGATAAPYTSPVGSNFSYAPIPATAVPAANDRLSFDWALGDIVNDADGDDTNDTLVIIYRARVVDNEPGVTIIQQPTTPIRNTANLTYMDGNGSPVLGLDDFADIDVRQPVMGALSKTDRSGRSSGDPVNVGTDTMNFRLETCNTINPAAPAYGLKITDTLPTELDNTSLTVPVVTIGGNAATDGVDYVYTPPAAGPAGRGGNLVFTFNTPIDPTECVNIDFDIGFYTDFGFGAFSNLVEVNEYYSLPPADAQLYGPLGPEPYVMSNPATVIPPPVKVKRSADEATIGDEVVYRITVPGAATGTILYNVTITDILHPGLVYVSATDTGSSGFTITDTVLPGNEVNLVIDQIPAGQQAIIDLRARVENNAFAQEAVSVENSASYAYADSPTGLPNNNAGSSGLTGTPISIIEPLVNVLKSVANITQPGLPPDAGDILRYSVTLTASGGAAAPADFFSNAYDVSLDDTLSLGMLYIDGTETVDGLGNTIDLPVKNVADGITTAQTLSWSLLQANADIDVPEGVANLVTVNYDVLVLDSVLADQNLSNSVDIQWSSRDGPNVPGGSGEFERDGSGLPLNDYFNLVSAVSLVTTPDNNTITKSRLSDTYDPVAPNDNIVRIGDIIEYQLVINMQEGTSPDFVVEDTLDEGLIFEGTVSINGQAVAPYPAVSPFSHAAIPAAIVSGDPATGPTTVTWTPGGDVLNPGDVINAGVGDNDITNNNFVIVYRARVLNLALDQIPTNTPLNNNVDFDYTMASGPAPTKISSQQLELRQPDLSVTKTSLPVDGSVINAGDPVTYTVEIFNGGDLPAYDTELLDTIPLGLRSPAITMVSMQLTSGAPWPGILPPVYDPDTGTATWDFDSGTADQYNIPAGDTLQIVYQVQADAGLGAGMTLTNSAQVQFYYSFDNDAAPSLAGINGVREIYGPSNLAQVTLTTTPANALLKINPADLDASIGESFTYRITVPGIPQATALYDVQILDDLTASDANLRFDRVDPVGTPTWTPVNITGTDNLIIADETNGIDIPAFGQIAVDVTVTLRNIIPPNTAALPSFSNAATYTFNQVNGDIGTVSDGLGDATPLMTIVEPNLTLVKTGPAGTVNFLAPIPYTVVVSNTGNGPAFDTTIVDQLPDVPDPVIPALTGGTCDAAPINIVASIVAVPVRPLLVDIDYTATHTAAPTCELVITTITDKARIEVGEQLIVTYETTLDVGTQSGAALTNIAGVTRWFSLDTAGAGATDQIREYTSIATSSAQVTVEAPVLDVQKTVVNVTTTQDPGDNATPGDRLSYTIDVTNNGLVDASAVTLTDAIPVNATYIQNTVTLNGLPVGQPDGGISPLVAGIDINSSELPAPAPGIITVGETATVTFDVLLNPAITSGTVISNQAIVDSPSTGAILSDDPVAPGTADPTTTLITSAPAFIVQKTSLDITGDPAILLPGDTLRYTLTVKNIGQEDSIDSLLTDNVPANTTYVANSTRLNSVLVADAAGVSPLATAAGMPINAPEDTTAGYLRADTDVAANNVATITFDVLVNATAVSGTVISNQGFFDGAGAGSGVFPQQPSDDPDTALVDDPTIDVVGNVPVINSVKTVTLLIDDNGNGFVDPDDTLRYTITMTNIGAMPASGVVLTDDLDLHTPGLITPVPGRVQLNGLPAGVDFVGSILTVTIGDLLPATSAVVTFEVTVDADVLPNTIISNQGSIASNELPIELTDADGNNANGYQTTDIVVGNVQQLGITKQVTVIGGGAAVAGGELEYVVRVTNLGVIVAQNVVITDELDTTVMSYKSDSGLLDGLPISDPVADTVTVNVGNLAVGGVVELRFRVELNALLTIGTPVFNKADVTWDDGTAFATVSIDIGGIPGAANINGRVWHDTNFDNNAGAEEVLLQDYRVELYRNGLLLANVLTDVDGVYSFSGLPPNTIANPYEVRFIAPGAANNTATLGTTNSDFTNGSQRITAIFAASGDNLQNLNLPRQVNGVVYDSVLRVPVAGVQLTMINQTQSNQLVPEECFGDGTNANQASQVTLADGYYKFDLNFDSSKCAQGDEYVIQVQPPASGFIGTTSVIIPPVQPVTGAAQDVRSCPNSAADKIPATAEHCENSASDVPAPVTVAPRTAATDYHLKFLFSDQLPGTPFTDQIYNNHIPVDGVLDAAVAISKVAGKLNVTRSDLVPYTITFNNTLGIPLFDVSIIDNFPAGFKYVTGSARVDGEEIEPQIDGRYLTWPGLNVGIDESRVIKLLLIVGSGVGEGEYVNSAWAINTLTGGELSGVATATVRVIPDPTFDCTDIIGKVFDDKNLNAYQDKGERGLPGVQVATARGLRVTTDSHGRFHITCAIVANEVRGSNFIMKLDDRTLPSGYRVTTENPRVQRATRGKMLKFNFGTAVHRVVRLDLADGVFEKDSTELRPQWRSRIDLLITELQKEGSILRLSYLAENETEDEVDDRLDAIEDLVSDRWEDLDCCYKLTIEKEVFWRKGSPSAGREFAE